MRNSLSGFGSVFRLTLNEIFCDFLFASFTNNKGISEKNAIIAAKRIIWLKSIAINQIKRKTKIEPRIAPAVSSALCIPNPFPRFSGIESAMIASRGAVLIPFPTRSNPPNRRIWYHIVENDNKSLNSADVK